MLSEQIKDLFYSECVSGKEYCHHCGMLNKLLEQVDSLETVHRIAVDLRDEVLVFSGSMEKRLKQTDYSPQANTSLSKLIKRLYDCTRELVAETDKAELDGKAIVEKAADVANVSMRISVLGHKAALFQDLRSNLLKSGSVNETVAELTQEIQEIKG